MPEPLERLAIISGAAQSDIGRRLHRSGIDLTIVRENTEGLYSGIEHMVTEGVAESLKVITHKGSTRIARYAFEYARKKGIGKVTGVHKANIMKVSDGLFLECVRAVREEFPEIEYDDVDRVRGMDITIVNTAKTDEHGRALLDAFGFPFRKDS